MKPNTRHRWLTAVAAWALCGAAVAWACDTPVWRYAMYRWTVEPYTLVVLEDAAAPVGEAPFASLDAAQLNLQVEHRVRGEQGQFELSEQFRPAAEAVSSALPAYLVVSPRGEVVDQGPFEAALVDRLRESAVRAAIVEQLAAGKAGLLLILTGVDSTANEQAEALAKGAIARAAAGLIPQNANLAANVVVESTEPPPQVGLLVVRRDDPQEAWLVKNLLALEADLAGYDTPMVFGVYGRGRAMEPYVGAGVTAENMDQCIGYITGACSCEIKEQNPGMDLLMAADWEAISDELSAEHADDDALGPASTPEQDLAVAVAATGGSEEPAVESQPVAETPAQATPASVPAADATVAPSGLNAAVDASAGESEAEDLPTAAEGTAYRRMVVRRLAVLGSAVVLVSALIGLALMRNRS